MKWFSFNSMPLICALEYFYVTCVDVFRCLWCCHHAVAALREFTLVHAVSAARRQVAAAFWNKPIGLFQTTTLTIAILLLLSPKADTHFTIPQRVEG